MAAEVVKVYFFHDFWLFFIVFDHALRSLVERRNRHSLIVLVKEKINLARYKFVCYKFSLFVLKPSKMFYLKLKMIQQLLITCLASLDYQLFLVFLHNLHTYTIFNGCCALRYSQDPYSGYPKFGTIWKRGILVSSVWMFRSFEYRTLGSRFWALAWNWTKNVNLPYAQTPIQYLDGRMPFLHTKTGQSIR